MLEKVTSNVGRFVGKIENCSFGFSKSAIQHCENFTNKTFIYLLVSESSVLALMPRMVPSANLDVKNGILADTGGYDHQS